MTPTPDAIWLHVDWILTDGPQVPRDIKYPRSTPAAACLAVYQIYRGDEPCRLDHHGLCQSHHLRRNADGEPECEVLLLRAAIAKAKAGQP